jgi:uncharacterized membrane protein
MKKTTVHLIPIFIMLLIPITGLCFYPWLPDKISCHWSGGSDPAPDSCMEKLVYVFLMPILISIPVLILTFLGWGLSEGKEFAAGLIIILSIALSLFMYFGQFLIYLFNVGVKFNMNKFMNFAMGVFLAIIISSVLYYSILSFLNKSRPQNRPGN